VPAEAQSPRAVGMPAGRAQIAAASTAVLAVVAFARFGLTAHAVLVALVAGVLVLLALVDVEERRIPNRIVLPATLATLAAQVAMSPGRSAEWVAAGLGAALFLLLPLLVSPNAVGMGDVKLALLLGAALGWSVAPALLIGLLAASVAGLALIALHGWSARKATIPLGPFLAIGGLAAVPLSL
jgi:leader peptidase (prepilin peptidase)/N-methyltransferase